MRVHFWGTRGSLPVGSRADVVRAKLRRALAAARGRDLGDDAALDRFIDEQLPFTVRGSFGGNSSCVQIDAGGPEPVVCDLGSGLRDFGISLMAGDGPPPVVNVFLSHVHWDHIMGFPFFTPAFVPGTVIRIHGGHDCMELALRRQQSAPCFPVPFDRLAARIEFVQMTPETWYEVAGLRVKTHRQRHGGDSYGFRFERDGRSVVYSTDGEHKLESEAETEQVVAFFERADLVIFDAMYSLADAISVKQDWGHSSNIVGVDLCHRAKARRYCLFHHEPACDDDMIQRIYDETVRYEQLMREGHPLEVVSAYDGLELEV